ncbi:hypothetical protein G5C51_28075 [Streptomyces sp. A7024]|uniref:Integral membrane protein n=1 Tax=Streptomyces coryli TaxID=1128680 RepID=A0A6G4U678_9ACTN|nr:DUF6332 family protein [Streptomyces coryli]NGN67745.1 hypothetical protein [Streptomyces coryli]
MRGPRTQTERDDTTVEIVYAAVTGVLLAGAAFALVMSPVLFLGDVPITTLANLWRAAKITAVVVFAARICWTLRRFGRR